MPGSKALSLDEYLRLTRGRAFQVLAVVSLLAVYEAGILLTGSTRRNAADALLRQAFGLLGEHGPTAFHAALLLLFIAAAVFTIGRGRDVVTCMPPFLVETGLYAAMLSPAVFLLQEPFLERPAEGLVLDIGAGVYEEIVFRYILIRGAFALIGMDPWRTYFSSHGAWTERVGRIIWPLTVVVLISSFAFAVYHHVGPGGEPLAWGVFAFRALAGLLLAGIFFARGLAAAVYTHAFYDVLVHFAA